MTGLKTPNEAWTGWKSWRRCRPGQPLTRAAYDVAEYVMKLREAVTTLAGDRTAAELGELLGAETARLVEELRHDAENDYWNTRVRPALLKSD